MPEAGLVWVSMFVIHPDFQRRQYGQQVAAGLSSQLGMLGLYRAIWLEVYLKNWLALRFWIAQGFTRIIEYDGARKLSGEAQASLVLEKAL
jgi:ribosomal protein S18 acetylase RimI-like enzyme